MAVASEVFFFPLFPGKKGGRDEWNVFLPFPAKEKWKEHSGKLKSFYISVVRTTVFVHLSSNKLRLYFCLYMVMKMKQCNKNVLDQLQSSRTRSRASENRKLEASVQVAEKSLLSAIPPFH